MNNPELFIAGIVVTLIVAGALALVLFGAVLDGRSDQARDTGVPVSPSTEGETPSPPSEPDVEALRATTEVSGAGDRHVVHEV